MNDEIILYGFFFTDCIFESGLMLQSLHRSKIGALRAMIAFQSERWEACRSGMNSGAHLECLGTFKGMDYRQHRVYEHFAIRTVKVLP